MSFVPGYKHDLFLSYAQEETAWVGDFRRALVQEFQERVGKSIDIWQDTKNVKFGQNWTTEIDEGVSQAAAFLAVVSPSYLLSPWCRRERAILVARFGGIENLMIDSFNRFLKIIKTPGPRDAHVRLLHQLQRVDFFNPVDGYEFAPDSKEYVSKIREAVRTIRELLTCIANRQQTLYLAPGPLEMQTESTDLLNQLTDSGYNVKPEILLSPEFPPESVQEEMETASAAIFLLGGVYDEFVEDQLKLAKEIKKPIIVWINPSKARTADPKQSALIADQLRELPANSQILGGSSIRVFIDQLSGVLAPKAQPAVVPDSFAGNKKVYLIYDSTLPGESQTATVVSKILGDRNLEVLRKVHDDNHELFMRISNGVLVFRASNCEPDNWLQSYVKDLRYAQQMFENEPEAKALLVSRPERIKQTLPNVDVLPFTEPFEPERLNPFINKLQQAEAAHGSR